MPLAWQITIEVLWAIMVDWLNNNPGVVQAAVALGTGLLALGTFWMGWQARKQAKASRQMAEGMERQRRASARPIIGITSKRSGATGNVWSLEAALRNVGMGPAVNVCFTCEYQVGPGGFQGDYRETNFAALGIGEDPEKIALMIELQHLTSGGRGNLARSPSDNFLTRLVCDYEDLYGSQFSSWLEIGQEGKEGLVAGPLILEQRFTGLSARRQTGSGTGL